MHIVVCHFNYIRKNWCFYNYICQFSECHCCVFMYFESIEALAEQVMCLKKLITSAFRSCEPLHVLPVLFPQMHRWA